MGPHLHVNEWHALDTAWMNMRGDWQWLWCKYIHTKTFKSHFPSISGVRLARTAKPVGLTFTEATLHSLVHQLTPPHPLYRLPPGSLPYIPPGSLGRCPTLSNSWRSIISYNILRLSLSVSLPGIFWSGVSSLTLLKGSGSDANTVCLSPHHPIPLPSTELSVWLSGRVYTNHRLMLERPVNKNKINPYQKAISGRPCYI